MVVSLRFYLPLVIRERAWFRVGVGSSNGVGGNSGGGSCEDINVADEVDVGGVG